VFFQFANYLSIVFGTIATVSLYNNRLNASLTSLCQTSGVSLIADNNRNLARRHLATPHGIDDRHHIRTTA
jgi:hypothetical protein